MREREQWVATYKFGKRTVHLDGVACDECPISFITEDSKRMLRLLNRSRAAHEMTGASLFGPDLSQWPAWAYDAAVVMRQKEQRVEQAMLPPEQ